MYIVNQSALASSARMDAKNITRKKGQKQNLTRNMGATKTMNKQQQNHDLSSTAA